ncbi:MAG: hypothetical protein V2I67_11885 [Thermoanaerobaculales bacterium]|jgi:hypothetical protein|nr:hypothetical protein [Thermoanaerobaculales bacterium]
MAARVDNPKARRNRLICRKRPVPDGWVVVGRHHSPACDGDGGNALVIKRPGRREVVTADSPVPEGYTRVRQTAIEGEDGPGWVIEREGPPPPKRG